jgi:hypothetical protein
MAARSKRETKTSTPASAPAVRSEIKGSGPQAGAGRAAAPSSRVITHDMIARRAFEIYASRGYAAGNQDHDWHEAERQLRAGL